MLIVVNEDDEEIGYEDELKCHEGDGILHRAFTILIFAGDRLILQERSGQKRLWPEFWETSCSGHPRAGEEMVDSSMSRLECELGFRTQLEDIGRFLYRERYQNIGTEYELCHVLRGEYAGGLSPNPQEVAKVRYVKLDLLLREIKEKRNRFAPWLEKALAFL